MHHLATDGESVVGWPVFCALTRCLALPAPNALVVNTTHRSANQRKRESLNATLTTVLGSAL